MREIPKADAHVPLMPGLFAIGAAMIAFVFLVLQHEFSKSDSYQAVDERPVRRAAIRPPARRDRIDRPTERARAAAEPLPPRVTPPTRSPSRETPPAPVQEYASIPPQTPTPGEASPRREGAASDLVPTPRPRPVLIARASAQRDTKFPPVKGKERRKRQFIRILLPIIVEENHRIRRERIQALMKATPEHYKKYDVKQGRRAALLKKIDTIPASLALAQAAIESGWGTSRFVREANNLYGHRTYKRYRDGVAPKDASGFRLVKFASIRSSVRSYMRNLNTHEAYSEFRNARKMARDKGETPGGMELAKFLQSYSELREAYILAIRRVIRKNNLAKYDHAQLAAR